tara:strand:+ start:1811 stop:2296 length:486 start_codon:yes stop_codon:yes gene_type:complete
LNKNIFILNKKNAGQCFRLISNNSLESYFFELNGWSKKQYFEQLSKKNNFSLGLINNNEFIGFILGDLINLENEIEYEILILYISKRYRKKGNATYLLEILKNTNSKRIKKLFLEVAISNQPAINFYLKNNFINYGIRKNYFFISKDYKENAILFSKNINQ